MTRLNLLFRTAMGIGLIALALAATMLTASAHEHRNVGAYAFVVGFVNEPTIQGDTNGLSLTVTSTKDNKPVEGLADTLKAQVIYQKEKKDLTLIPVYNQPGAYQSVFIPTQAGDYTFHITGTINGQQVDESFTSGPDTFDSVAPRTDYEFPAGKSSSASDRLAMPASAAGVMLALLGGAYVLYRRRLGTAA